MEQYYEMWVEDGLIWGVRGRKRKRQNLHFSGIYTVYGIISRTFRQGATRVRVLRTDCGVGDKVVLGRELVGLWEEGAVFGVVRIERYRQTRDGKYTNVT